VTGQEAVLCGLSEDGKSEFLRNVATNITYTQDPG
jgi:hypothetical protein